MTAFDRLMTPRPAHHPQPNQNRYRLDGRLAKATRIKGIKDFNARDYGLVEIPVSLWGGHLVFLHLGGVGQGAAQQQEQEEQPSRLGHLAPLLERLEAEHGFSEGMRHVARRTYRLNCNWKVRVWVFEWKPCLALPCPDKLNRPLPNKTSFIQVVIDNYTDNAMHVPYAHKALGSNLDLDSYTATLHDGFSIQVRASG